MHGIGQLLGHQKLNSWLINRQENIVTKVPLCANLTTFSMHMYIYHVEISSENYVKISVTRSTTFDNIISDLLLHGSLIMLLICTQSCVADIASDN